MSDSTQKLKQTWARVVAKAWADEDFKRRLLADPAAVAREEGVAIPDGLALKVIEDAPGTRTLVLPPTPTGLGPIVACDERILAAGGIGGIGGNGGNGGAGGNGGVGGDCGADVFYCDGGSCFST